MKTTRSVFRQQEAGLASAVMMLFVAQGNFAADETPKAKPEEKATKESKPEETAEYRNWVQVGVGSTFIDGDKAAFQRRHSLPRGAFGGVEDFHFEQDVEKRGLFSVDGRGIFDTHDYDIRLNLSHPEKGYLRAGYREFRTWYDGSGGYFPRNGQWISLYNEDFELDRGEAWIEGGLTLPDWPEFRVKYSRHFRDGMKDSTSWGDTTRTGLPAPNNVRGIVPSFWLIDEERDIFEVDAKHTLGRTDFGVGMRVEFSENNNSRNMHRRPGETVGGTAGSSPDRFLTQKEGVESDLFSAHAFTETRITEKTLFTTGYSFTTMDTDISAAGFTARITTRFTIRCSRDDSSATRDSSIWRAAPN